MEYKFLQVSWVDGKRQEARGWNVGAVCSDFNLVECIWRKSPQRTIIWPYYWKGQIRVCWGLYLLIHSTKLKSGAHSANIPASCVWIDAPHAYVWTSWNFHFLMGGSNFEVKIHPANCQNVVKKNWIPFLLYKRQSNQVLPH